MQFHLVQLHVWSLVRLGLLSLILLIATVHTAVIVTAWSALWLASQLRRAAAPLAVRLSVDLVLVVASVVLGIPW